MAAPQSHKKNGEKGVKVTNMITPDDLREGKVIPTSVFDDDLPEGVTLFDKYDSKDEDSAIIKLIEDTKEIALQLKDNASISLIANLQLVRYLTKGIDKIKALMQEYRTIENLFIGRDYPFAFLQKRVIKPKTFIVGSDSADVIHFQDVMHKTIQMFNRHFDHIKKLVDDTEIEENLIEEIKKEVNLTIGAKAIAEGMLEVIKNFTDQYSVKFHVPKHKSIIIAKNFRDLLIVTQGIARQAEILFCQYFQELIGIHPEVRQDYQRIEANVNMLFQNLNTSQGVVYLDISQIANCLKAIIRSLYNIAGDFSALNVHIINEIQPMAKSKELSTFLQKIFGKNIDEALKVSETDVKIQ